MKLVKAAGKNIILSAFVLSSTCLFADPYTDQLYDNPKSAVEILKYFSKKEIRENGSLPSVSSKFKSANGRIHGSSFVVDVDDLDAPFKRVILTNSHLLQGSKKKAIIDIVKNGHFRNKIEVQIQDKDTFFCAEQDIGIVNIDNYKEFIGTSSLGRYDKELDIFFTTGQNNSPRGFYLKDNYGESFPFKNKNKRPLFRNTYSNEMLHFYQMGNMYDLSCNYFPSSPENYDGNAIFIPVSSRRKVNFVDPIPFVQKIFNRPNQIMAHRDRIKQGKCRVELDGSLKNDEMVKISYLSNKLSVPAGIVPGMSGSPLLINPNLLQDKYKIAGMVTTYDRRMQQSHFISAKQIKNCLERYKKKFDKEKAQDLVTFDYSTEFNTLYRSSENFVEIPIATNSAGSIFHSLFGGEGAAGSGGEGAAGSGGEGAAGSGGEGAAGSGGEGAAGSGGEGAAGSGGDVNGKEEIKDIVKAGLMYKGKHAIGFSCIVGGKIFNVFANWESRTLVNTQNCKALAPNNSLSLIELFTNKKNKVKMAKNHNLHSLELQGTIELKKSGDFSLNLKGSYYLKEVDEKISFRKKIQLPKNADSFNPYMEIDITEEEITSWFTDHKGGEVLILDLTELFFINMDKVEATKDSSLEKVLKNNNHPRIFGSLRYKSHSKGSVPIMLEWK